MSATLSIVNNFDLSAQGLDITGKQGAATAAFATAYDITVTGTCHRVIDAIPTATVRTAYDASTDFPATFAYVHYWADQITYVQIVSSATNATFKIAAYQPFVLPGYGTILAAANTTLITGGSEPTLAAVAKIAVGNYSGSTANYILSIIL